MDLHQVAEFFSSNYANTSEITSSFATEAVLKDGDNFVKLLQQDEIRKIDQANNFQEFGEVKKNNLGVYGERIVAKLDSIGREFKENMERAHKEINKPVGQLSLVDSLKIQYDFAVVSLHIEVVSKGVQKAVQNVDTLVKMQ